MKSKVAILLIIVFMFNGLNDARELDDLSILSAIGIDVNKEGEYVITSQVLNAKKADSSSGSSSGTSVVVYETQKKSVHEALRSTIEKVANKLYIGHLELLLISEEAAKKDILDTLDFFLRDNEGGNNFMVVISKDCKPQDVLEKLSAITTEPAKAIYDSITSTYEYEGTSTNYLLYDTLDMILNDKREIVVASMSLDLHKNETKNIKSEKSESGASESSDEKESESDGSSSEKSDSSSSSLKASTNNFKVTELAYFRNRKFEGYLEKNDAIVYNLLQNRLKSTVVSVGEGKDLITMEVSNAKSKMTPKFEDGNFSIDIDVKINVNITETGKNTRENMSDEYKNYQKNIEDIVEEKIKDALEDYRSKYKSDIVGIENLIYKKLNKEYKKIENEFTEKYLENVKTNVNVTVDFPLEGGDMVDGRSK